MIEALSKRVQALETCCRYEVVEPIWINRQLNLKTPLEKCSVEAEQKKTANLSSLDHVSV